MDFITAKFQCNLITSEMLFSLLKLHFIHHLIVVSQVFDPVYLLIISHSSDDSKKLDTENELDLNIAV